MKNKTIPVLILASALIAAVAAWQGGWDTAGLDSYIDEHGVLGAMGCVGIFVISTVLPISALPLLPLAARSYGVWTTVLLSTCGWWLGCLIAFLIARWARASVERFVSLRALYRLEERMPPELDFSAIVMLRLVFPGDLVGFALGLLKHVPFRIFAIASLVGTIPTAIALSYAGGELAKGQFVSCAVLVAATTLGAILLKRCWPDKRRAGASATDGR